jgi:hypothetical protein
MEQLVILGGGRQAFETSGYLLELGHTICCFLESTRAKSRPHGEEYPGEIRGIDQLLLRTSAIQAVGFQSDAALCNALISSGWEAAISTEVVHRHLSWLHAFDEPMYDTGSRQRFFELLTEEGRVSE